MPFIDLPQELSKSYWDKKKGAIPASSPLETQLKAFEKKFGAIDWAPYEAGWELQYKTLDALESGYAALDRAWRGKVMPLKLEANGVGDTARKLAKEKGLAKPTIEATRDIAEAVKAFGTLLDSRFAELEKARDKTASQLKDRASEEDDEPGSALVDPKRLLAQLQMSRRMPDRRAAFAVVSDGKADPIMSVSPKMTATRLFAKLRDETGIKTGSYGRAWVLGKVLYLEMEKPLSNLVKKVRVVLKGIGFKASKIVLVGQDGAEFESDDAPEDADDPIDADSPAEPVDVEAMRLAYLELLKTVGPQVARAVGDAWPRSDEIRQKSAEAAVFGRTQDWPRGLTLLREVQTLIDAAASSLPAGGASATKSGGNAQVAAATGSTVLFTQTRLVWDQARKKVQSELRKLETAILAACKDEPDAKEIAEGTRNLYIVLDYLDERLIDKLDEALNATSAEERNARHGEAREIVDEYVDFIESEDLMRDIDDNGFAGVAIRSTLTASLQAIGKRLAA